MIEDIVSSLVKARARKSVTSYTSIFRNEITERLIIKG